MNLIRLLFKSFFFYIFIPLLLLSGIEIFLRYEGWGKNLFPWVEHTTEQGKVYTKNLDFYQQFFEHPIHLGEFEPNITAIRLPKPENTIRIFVFGESAALGWPDAKYSFGKFLEIMLNQMYTQYHWEVFNVCSAGINSHVLRYIARNSLFLQPDMVLIYMGNNEVHGTFGLLHDFKSSIPQPPWLVQLQIQLKNLYITQNLNRFFSFPKTIFSKYAQIRFDNPNLLKVKSHFEKNLKAITNIFSKRGIPVFVGSMASNLRDWPPRDTWFKPDIKQEQISQWENHIDAGIKNLMSNNIEEAKKDFDMCIKIDDSTALTYFLLGWCAIAEKNYEEARKNFIEAREKDGFGFVRAKQFINDTIVKITKKYGEENRVFFVSVEQELASNAFAHVPGNEMFVDSCHFNLYGSYLTALAYLKSISKHISINNFSNTQNVRKTTIPTFEETKLFLVSTIHEKNFFNIFMGNNDYISVINYPSNGVVKNLSDFLSLMHQKYLPDYVKRTVGFYDFSSMESFISFYDSIKDKDKYINLIIKYLEILKTIGAFQQGIKTIESFLDKNINDVNFCYLAIDFYLNSKNLSRLDTLLQKYQQIYMFHDISEYLLKYAILKEDWNTAVDICEKIISNPYKTSTQKALARCVLIEQNSDLSTNEKIFEWKTILQSCQWSWDSFDFVYQTAKKLGVIEEYKKILTEIINEKSQSPFPYNFLAFVYEDEGNISNAIDMVRKGISTSSYEIYNSYELSRLLTIEAEQLLNSGQIEKANNNLEEAVKKFPYYLTAWNLLIETCKIMGDEEVALQNIDEYTQIQNKGILKHLWEIAY